MTNKTVGVSLTERTANMLRAAIEEGQYQVGDRLWSAATLSKDYGVSRTVIREAIAALRSEGLVESRNGAGLYLKKDFRVPISPSKLNSLPDVINMLELRATVEVEAAGLAAQRGSPAQHAMIREALQATVGGRIQEANSAGLDFGFHKAISDATNNPWFGEFLDSLGLDSVPRSRLVDAGDGVEFMKDYMDQLHTEHTAVYDAIAARDAEEARAAMRAHLSGGLLRYQRLLKGR